MQIHWVDPRAVDELQKTAVEQRIRALAEGHDDLIDVRVTSHSTRHHKHGAREVKIVAEVRGTQIVAARTGEDAALALDEALDAFERELRNLRDLRRQRRSGRPAEAPELGVVERVIAGEDHGFILTDAGERVYFHRNSVKHGLDFDELDDGQRVALNLEGGEKGLQATVVYPPPPDSPAP